MKEIIRLKHWQVFCIIALGYIFSFVLQISNFKIGSITSLELAAVVSIITLVLLFLWTLIIGLFLNNIPDKQYHFRNWVLIIAVCLSIIGYSSLILQTLVYKNELIPFWLSFTPLTFWAVCYTFYTVAKSLKSIELGREAKFSECIIDAITLFALLIGIWFIQPRINRILTVVEQIEHEK